MSNLNVAVIGSPEYSKDLGKIGTISDFTFFNLKKEDVTVTMIEPSRYPEKLSSLFYTISMAQKVVLVVDEINAQFGESVLMLNCAGITNGILILRNYITPEQVAPLIRDTVVGGYELFDDDRMRLREHLLDEAAKIEEKPPTAASPPGAMPIDHSFPVKGIGTVALGCVVNGVIRRHDNLQVLPTKHMALVRSIQKHDADAEIAYPGDRIGFALKGVEAEDLERGYVLSKDPALTSSSTIHGRAELIKYWPSALKEGMVLYIGHWMQFIPSKVAYANNAGDWHRPELTLKTEKELVYPPGARAILHYLEGGKLRVVGTIIIE
jgi:selenocysteine-specific translation elongation factor